jgi:hypothetical protein
MAKKDSNKRTTHVSKGINKADDMTPAGKPKDDSYKNRTSAKDYSKSQFRTGPKNEKKTPSAYSNKTEKKAAPKKKESIKDKVKKVLPSKKVTEDREDWNKRQTASNPRSRKQFVADQKKSGGKYTPRTETKKGWGKNAKVTKRKLDE